MYLPLFGRSDSLRALPRSHTSNESFSSFNGHGAPHRDGFDTDTENNCQSDFEDEPLQPSTSRLISYNLPKHFEEECFLHRSNGFKNEESLWLMFLVSALVSLLKDLGSPSSRALVHHSSWRALVPFDTVYALRSILQDYQVFVFTNVRRCDLAMRWLIAIRGASLPEPPQFAQAAVLCGGDPSLQRCVLIGHIVRFL